MRTLFRYLAFPLVLGGAGAGAFIALARGVEGDVVVVAVSAACIVAVALLERVLPYLASYNQSRGDIPADALHSVISGVLLPEGLRLSTFGWLYTAGAALSAWLGVALWPSSWPLPAQVGLALLVADLGSYWFHRLQHNHPFWWRMHATHHSAPRLYWLNGGRFHPLDGVTSYAVAIFPLVILGAPAITLAAVTVFITAHGLLQHSNIDMKLGPFNWVFSTAELHRWHHSPVVAEQNHNYGVVLVFWDILFGTRFLPADRQPPERVGIGDMPDFPRDYLGQLASPFRWRALEARAAQSRAGQSRTASSNHG